MAGELLHLIRDAEKKAEKIEQEATVESKAVLTRAKETAKRLWLIYVLFTAAETILLMFGGMDLFDAINHSFTTMATGGYSTKQASAAHWDSAYIHYVMIIFMFIAGTNFTLAYFGLKFKFKKIINNEEFRYYFGFTLFFTIITAITLFFTTDFGAEKLFSKLTAFRTR